MKLGTAIAKSTPRMIRRLQIANHLKLATAKKQQPLLVSGSESSDGTRSISKVPKGFLAVYVGPHSRRFVIPVSFLATPHFRDLMDAVANEYGCHHNGAIQIPCDEQLFEQILISCSQTNTMHPIP